MLPPVMSGCGPEVFTVSKLIKMVLVDSCTSDEATLLRAPSRSAPSRPLGMRNTPNTRDTRAATASLHARCLRDGAWSRRHAECAPIVANYTASLPPPEVRAEQCVTDAGAVRSSSASRRRKLRQQLTGIAQMHALNCTWVCLEASLHCIAASQAVHRSQGSMLRGHVWEAECKALMRSKAAAVSGRGDVAIAGLFGGDWLPLAASLAGPHGRVFGFEPTAAVTVSRATADANGLNATVQIAQACLSDRVGTLPMCVRRAGGAGSAASGAAASFGDRTHVVRPDERQSDGSTACITEAMPCTTLDDTLPWRTRPVALVLLDVEGHEEPALRGAIQLVRRWRPLLATEQELAGRLQPSRVFREVLAPLGYRADGKCPGLHLYRARA